MGGLNVNKKIGLILAVTCTCLLLGCCTPVPSTPNTLPPCIMVDDVLYYYTGREIPDEIDEDSILGIITSTVSLTEMPTENGQSNMTSLLDCPYAKHEEKIAVLMEEKWMLFETRDID